MLTADIAATGRTSEASKKIKNEATIRLLLSPYMLDSVQTERPDASVRRVATCVRECVAAVRRGERVVPEWVRDGLTVGDVVTVDGVGYTIGAGWRIRLA